MRIAQGLLRATRARGLLRTIRLVALDTAANRLGFPVNSHTKELLFWEKQAMGIGSFSHNFLNKVDCTRQWRIFPERIAPYVEDQRQRRGAVPDVLDVGAGPVSLLTHAHRKGYIRLTASDILANAYRQLLTDYGYAEAISGVELVQVPAETLVEELRGRSFDIVYCNNALDHTHSPLESFTQITRLCKSGGYIIVSGNMREGTHEQWDGIHMHDLFVDSDGLFREGRTGTRTRLDEGLPLTTLHLEIDDSGPIEKMFIVFSKS